MELLSKKDEQRLFNAVRTAIKDVNSGATPNDAICKAATAENFLPDFVARMVEMYNTSKTLSHLQKSAGLARAADFPLADIEVISERLFPGRKVETKVASETGLPTNLMAIKLVAEFEKTAAAPLSRDPLSAADRVINIRQALSKKVEVEKTKLAELQLERDKWFSKTAAYFSSIPHVPFEEVDSRMQTTYGQLGKLAMDATWTLLSSSRTRRLEKRGEAKGRPYLVSRDVAPYSYLLNIINISRQLSKQAEVVEAAVKEYSDFDKEFKSRVCSGDPVRPFQSRVQQSPKSVVKTAQSVITGAAIGSAIGKHIFPEKPTPEKAFVSSVDPEHEAALRSVRSEAMLQDLITSDPIISKYDPTDVVNLYNEFSRVAPSSSDKLIVVRGYLRRMLEGNENLEPYEVSQLADVEKKMVDVQSPSPLELFESLRRSALKAPAQGS